MTRPSTAVQALLRPGVLAVIAVAILAAGSVAWLGQSGGAPVAAGAPATLDGCWLAAQKKVRWSIEFTPERCIETKDGVRTEHACRYASAGLGAVAVIPADGTVGAYRFIIHGGMLTLQTANGMVMFERVR